MSRTGAIIQKQFEFLAEYHAREQNARQGHQHSADTESRDGAARLERSAPGESSSAEATSYKEP